MRRLSKKKTRSRRSNSRQRRSWLERLYGLLTWHREATTWQRRIAMTAAAFVVVVVLIGTANWIIRADIPGRIAASIHDATVGMTLAFGFSVEEVYVADRNETERRDLLQALGTKLGDPILYFDADAARDRIMKLGWVEDARVERRLPTRIVVVLKERKPVAIWQHQGDFVLVDGEGIVIGPKAPDRFSELKILIGNEAPKHAGELLAMLEREPDMMKRVTHATWVSGRQWNIRIENAIDVKLPADNPEAAWRKLADMERDYQVLGRDITTVDLRIPEKTTVRVNGKSETIATRDNQT
jgi:cell division protein FtsQ